MRRTEVKQFEMLVRVSGFGKTNRDLFPPDSLAGQAFETVHESVSQLGKRAVSKMTSAKGGKHSRVITRRALVERLLAISRIARVIGEDAPGFDEPFQMPASRSDQALLAAGRVFAQQAEAQRSRFAAYGVPEAHLTCFPGLADDFEAAIAARRVGREEHTAARAGIESAMAAALAALRKLDLIVPNLLHDNPVLLAVWEDDRRVEFFSRGRKPKAKAEEVNVEGAKAEEPKAEQPPLKVAS
ncbi:MAG: hypothetical protein ABL986_04580 [Vicinamibacterales bacterium]